MLAEFQKAKLFVFWFDFRQLRSGDVFVAVAEWLDALKSAFIYQLSEKAHGFIAQLTPALLAGFKTVPSNDIYPLMALLPRVLAYAFGFQGIWCMFDEFDKTFPRLTFQVCAFY